MSDFNWSKLREEHIKDSRGKRSRNCQSNEINRQRIFMEHNMTKLNNLPTQNEIFGSNLKNCSMINVDRNMQKMVIEWFMNNIATSDNIADCIVEICLLYLTHKSFLIVYDKDIAAKKARWNYEGKHGTFNMIDLNNQHNKYPLVKMTNNTNVITKISGMGTGIYNYIYIPNHQLSTSLLSNYTNNNVTNPSYSYDVLINSDGKMEMFLFDQYKHCIVDILPFPFDLPKQAHLSAYSSLENKLIAIDTHRDYIKDEGVGILGMPFVNQTIIKNFKIHSLDLNTDSFQSLADNMDIKWKLLHQENKPSCDYTSMFNPLTINHNNSEYIIFGYGKTQIKLYNINENEMKQSTSLKYRRAHRGAGACFNKFYDELIVCCGMRHGGGCIISYNDYDRYSDVFNFVKNRWYELPETKGCYEPPMTWIDYSFSPNVLHLMENHNKQSTWTNKISDVICLDMRSSEKRKWQKCPKERQINTLISHHQNGWLIHPVTSTPWI
eukprot:88629_1